MTKEEAHAIVDEYQRSGALPDGFTADTSRHENLQGDKYEVVQILQNNSTVLSYTVKNGHIEGDIDLVPSKV